MRFRCYYRMLAALGFALVLTACAGAPAARRQTVLTYAFPDDPTNTAVATALISAYMSSNPQFRIEAQPIPASDYAQQLLDRLDRNAPDLFFAADPQVPTLIKRNALLDVSPLLPAVARLAPTDFQPVPLSVWRRGAALYGLPADVVPHVLFYNRDLFDAAGLAYPVPGWTWNDWLTAAKQLSTPGGQAPRYGTALMPWSAMVWGNGGELLSADGKHTLLDRPEAAAGIQFAAAMVNVHHVAPPPPLAGGPDPIELFKQQRVAMLPAPSSMMTSLLEAKLPFRWGIAPLPAGPVPASPLSVAGLAVSARSANKEAALAFASWAVGPEGNKAKAHLLPFAAPALTAAGARPAEVPGAEAIAQALPHGRTLPQVEQWPAIADLVNQALIPVWQGQMTAAAAYAQVAPKIDALLAAG